MVGSVPAMVVVVVAVATDDFLRLPYSYFFFTYTTYRFFT
jgi:hypothetical protein